MRIPLGGYWLDRREQVPVLNPFDGSVVDTVPATGPEDVETALASAARGARVMASTAAYRRSEMLRRSADLMRDRAEELARTITLEEGKAIREARTEVGRAVETVILSSEEARRLYGETVPLDAAPSAGEQLGFTLRVPCGVVVAISPFNFPLNLVCHKVGPALAAGNSVVIKPASDTPLSAIKLVEVLQEAGFPPESIQCLPGPGSRVGDALCADRRVRKITFTGSYDVGEHICRVAGMKRVTMELGSNCPLVLLPDADIEKAARATVASGYANAGQVCISTQRVLADGRLYGDYLDALGPLVEAIRAGNPVEEEVGMGPLVREQDAARVEEWVQEAASTGARVLVGGRRDGAMYAPTVVSEVRPEMRVSREELFGPAVGVSRVGSVEEAIGMANDSRYGLSAAVFTQNVEWAMRFARQVHSGNVHINSGPSWRADLMPYGGLKGSGVGKEGPRYAIEEMTELKMVVFHPGER